MERSIAVAAPRLALLNLSISLLLIVAVASPSNQEFEGITGRSLEQEHDHTHGIHCSRDRSRAAWKIIDEYLMPFVEKENYKISSRCRLHADNNLFRDQEMHKIHVDVNDWQCGYCKKSFRAEKFLDQHFDNRHYNLLNVMVQFIECWPRVLALNFDVRSFQRSFDMDHSKCLADLCGALHCDLVMDSKLRKTKCNPAAASKNRHLCESLANSCFPVSDGPSASRLHELFLRQFCDSHTCNGGPKPFSRGGKKQTSTLYIAISAMTLVLLPLFYFIVYLHHWNMRAGVQDLKRIPRKNQKTKPF